MRQVGVHLAKSVPYGDKERTVIDIYRPYDLAQSTGVGKAGTDSSTDRRNMALADFINYIARHRDSRES